MGQMELKCIFIIGKNISIWAKVTQVSDVVHGPLVILITVQAIHIAHSTYALLLPLSYKNSSATDRLFMYTKILIQYA
jgi:hypothetical protein